MKTKLQALSALLLALALSLSLSVPALAAEPLQAVTNALSTSTAAASAKEAGGAVQLDWALWMDGAVIQTGSLGGDNGASGHLKSLAAATADHRYCVGSVSKIYTTVAVMQLAEAGKLDLDQPVVKYLPEFKMADARYKDITVRMLLNHSSGLMGSSISSAMLFEDASAVSTDRLLETLAGQRLKADPGAFSVYCNDGFTLAQLVVERVADTNFQDYLHAHVFDPAGLEETWFPDEILSAELSVVPTYLGEEATPMDCLGIVGAGGIYATASDLAAFGGALTGETLLSQKSLDAMAAPEYARGLWPEEGPDALAFGLGWDNVEWYPFAQNGITALVKGGDTQFYHAGLVVLPEHKMAAAVVSSGGVSTYNEMAASQLLIAALEAKGVKVDQTPLTLPEAGAAAMPKELTELSGYYGSLVSYKVDVTEDGKLTMHYLNTPQIPDAVFHYYSDGTFRDEENVSALRLVKEKNGQVYLHQWAFASLPGLGGLPASNYAAVKLPENAISPALQEQWNTRMGGAVLPMNERYSSQLYASMGALLQVESGDAIQGAPGYVGSMRIVDETHLRYPLQIPGNTGRDGSDIEVRRDEKGVLWFYQSNGGVYMDIGAVSPLSTGKDGKAACTIQADGYARWYKVGDNAAGKTMTVQLPEDAGFWAYAADGTIAASSVLRGDRSVKLPEGGLIVFAGDPGARFSLTFS